MSELTGLEVMQEFARHGLFHDPIQVPAVFFTPGVYVLLNAHLPVYVGMSVNAHYRIKEHCSKRDRDPLWDNAPCNRAKMPYEHFDMVHFYSSHPEDVRGLEAALIRLLRPELNSKRPLGGPKTDEWYIETYAKQLYDSLMVEKASNKKPSFIVSKIK